MQSSEKSVSILFYKEDVIPIIIIYFIKVYWHNNFVFMKLKHDLMHSYELKFVTEIFCMHLLHGQLSLKYIQTLFFVSWKFM